MATHSNILAMERSLAGCSPGVCKKSRIPTEQLDNHLIIPVNLKGSNLALSTQQVLNKRALSSKAQRHDLKAFFSCFFLIDFKN